MWNQLIQLSFRSKVGPAGADPRDAGRRDPRRSHSRRRRVAVDARACRPARRRAQHGRARLRAAGQRRLPADEEPQRPLRQSGDRRRPRRGCRRRQRGGASPAPAQWAQRYRGAVSAQRNIVKPRDWQRYPYPFIYGQIDPSQLPMPGWRECSLQATVRVGSARLGGRSHRRRRRAADRADPDAPARAARRVRRRRTRSSSPSARSTRCSCSATLLVDAGTTVGIENPGYPDARNIFAARTSNVVPLPLDGGGLALSPALDALRLRVPDAVASVPDERDDAARAPRSAARVGAGQRPRADRGRLRDRARVRGARASGAAKPRPQRSRRSTSAACRRRWRRESASASSSPTAT